jgi:hypothetical protein
MAATPKATTQAAANDQRVILISLGMPANAVRWTEFPRRSLVLVEQYACGAVCPVRVR